MMATLHPNVVVDGDSQNNIFKVTILPPFWADRPALWFSQAEAIFETAGITRDRAKYGYVLSQLPERFAAEVEDIITNPPNEDRYNYLKAELIRRRVRQQLSKEELGERKPTQFLAHLRAIAGNSLHNEAILKQVFFRRLPSQMQNVFSGHTDIPLEKLASLADRILDFSNQNTRSAPSPSSESESESSENDPQIEDLTHRVESLTRQVSILTLKLMENVTSNKAQSRGRSGNDICWYHRRWQNKAHKCVIPCGWNGLPKRDRF